MHLPPNLKYLLVDFKLIKQVNILQSFFSEFVTLLVGECVVAHRVVFFSAARIILLYDLIDFS